MLMAHRTADARVIAHTVGILVLADTVITATSVIFQLITGVLLAWQLGWQLGWSLSEGRIAMSLLLYVLTGLFWLPVVWIQVRLRDYATQADRDGTSLPSSYYKLFRRWFACGISAFAAVLAIPWLMLARPHILPF